jgi:hypothetical protein
MSRFLRWNTKRRAVGPQGRHSGNPKRRRRLAGSIGRAGSSEEGLVANYAGTGLTVDEHPIFIDISMSCLRASSRHLERF